MLFENDKNKMIETLKNLKEKSLFKRYITRLVFPYFKNYTYFSEINFHYPLTVFVGKNGTGKSSALHALYGSPQGKNISDFWFSTEMDPIEEFGKEKEKHSFFYEYKDDDGNSKEVLYHRIFHKVRKDPDYWETDRPRKKYRMKEIGKRNKPVTKNLIHLDFRSELSAFDKYFYFGSTENLKAKTKQDYLRSRSIVLKNAIKDGAVRKIRSKEQNETVIDLTTHEIDMISFILEEEYTSGKMIKHKFFGSWGTSVILNKEDVSYSEAQAGSGEIAVVMLVHNILNAEPHSLILLDEPEVSLHPGAQSRLQLMLLQQIIKNKHQIVIATHSPVFTEGLPKQAIKRFTKNLETGKTDIIDECYTSEAFKHLGLSSKYDGALIHVEDALMKKLLTEVIGEKGERFKGVKIYFTPGGAATIQNNYIVHYSKDSDKKCFVYLDGDQKNKVEIPASHELKVGDVNPKYLSKLIKDITSTDVKFIKDGGTGDNREDQLIEAQIAYLEYYREQVRFFPIDTPEDLIWDWNYVRKMLPQNSDKTIEHIESKDSSKEKIYAASKILLGNDEAHAVDSLETLLVRNWLAKNDEYKQKILEDLDCFMTILNS